MNSCVQPCGATIGTEINIVDTCSTSVGIPMNMFIQSSNYQPTPLSQSFLHPNNVAFILENISKNVSDLVGEPVIVGMSSELAADMVYTISHNVGYAYQPAYISFLNQQIIDKEIRIQLASVRQKALYNKWFLQNNRLKVLPRATKPDGPAKDVIVSPSDYMLTNPSRQYKQQYLKDVFCLKSCGPCNTIGLGLFNEPKYKLDIGS